MVRLKDRQPKTLIVWGRNDPLIWPAAAETVKLVMPAPDLRYFDGGHFVLGEYAAEITREADGSLGVPFVGKGWSLGAGDGENAAFSTIAKVNAETQKANAKLEAAGEKLLPLPLVAFEPYVMRHTALTRMAPFCDAFTLARIAGHSSITITQRYCHPQADAVEAAFSKYGNRGGLVPQPEGQKRLSLP